MTVFPTLVTRLGEHQRGEGVGEELGIPPIGFRRHGQLRVGAASDPSCLGGELRRVFAGLSVTSTGEERPQVIGNLSPGSPFHRKSTLRREHHRLSHHIR